MQAAWNFKGMQNIGFTYTLIPGLKYILKDRADEAVRRSIPFFNTQPYMAPTIAGVCLHLYEKGEEDKIQRMVALLSSSLAALGDTFFWARLKPFAALLMLVCVMAGAPWGMVIVILAYNAIHFWIMGWGFLEGYHSGMDGALAVGKAISVDSTDRLPLAVSFLCGVVLCLSALWFSRPGVTGAPVARFDTLMWLGIALLALHTALRKMNVHLFWFIYGVFALTVIWTMFK